MITVADFKRAAAAGTVWRCEHFQNPKASGLRRVIGGTSVLSYQFRTADGRTGANGRMEIPKASEVSIRDNTIAWVENGKTLYTWTAVPAEDWDTEDQAGKETK